MASERTLVKFYSGLPHNHAILLSPIRFLSNIPQRSSNVCSYPLGHPEAPSYKADLQYLKSKVDAGAQFIITQLFFEAEVFEQFVRDCREIGINVPIIPGIMPIMGYDSIRRIATLSQLTIPESILSDLEPIKHDDDAVRKYGTIKVTFFRFQFGEACSAMESFISTSFDIVLFTSVLGVQ
ncbi:unnamed protein product [Nippostrongylus brasiliensis]|uniref:Methylenetetrahydrofolate reductase [NAD(P)H] n=1 Tax=Nippostrongylus brasiliensis TaxID=27835 RepID=A0A0N4XSK5_NIPBR|nr:unnamed protein product [Nippostrongylus brasiliensis]